MDFEIISCGRTNPNGSSLPFPFVGRWVARGYKSQSKGGSGAGCVGDDGDNGDVDAMTIVMAMAMIVIMVIVMAPPPPLVGQLVVWGYTRQ